jgi:hypothetical protein
MPPLTGLAGGPSGKSLRLARDRARARRLLTYFALEHLRFRPQPGSYHRLRFATLRQ